MNNVLIFINQIRDFTEFCATTSDGSFFYGLYFTQTSDENRFLPFDSKFNSSLAYLSFNTLENKIVAFKYHTLHYSTLRTLKLFSCLVCFNGAFLGKKDFIKNN